MKKNLKNRKWLKIAVFSPWMTEFWPFCTIVCKSLLKSYQKTVKMTKKGPKVAVFRHGGVKFANIKKGLDILLLLPQRGWISNFRKFGTSHLEKMRYWQKDGRTNGWKGLKSWAPLEKFRGPTSPWDY